MYHQCHGGLIRSGRFQNVHQIRKSASQCCKGSDFDTEYNDVMALYDSDFEGIRFHVQLETLSEYCKEIVDTVSVRTLTKVLRNLEVGNHLCEVYKLAKLIMVMPATNSVSGRTFSLLKLMKTYLRSTMTKGRLNHLMILSAYRNRLDEMDLRKVASIFVQKNDGRRYTFGKFKFC